MTEQTWQQMVMEWRAGTESVRAFAVARGVTVTALGYWVRKMGGRRGSAQPEPISAGKIAGRGPALARVVRATPSPGPGRTSGVMVMVGRALIAVEPGFDAAHLRDVVRALGELA